MYVEFSTIVVDVIWILKTKTELIHYISNETSMENVTSLEYPLTHP
jgi:hypothetical protein